MIELHNHNRNAMDTSESPEQEHIQKHTRINPQSSGLESQMKRIKLNKPNSNNSGTAEPEIPRKRVVEQDQNHKMNGKRQKITWP